VLREWSTCSNHAYGVDNIGYFILRLLPILRDRSQGGYMVDTEVHANVLEIQDGELTLVKTLFLGSRIVDGERKKTFLLDEHRF